NLIGAWAMYFAGERVLELARRVHNSFERPQWLKRMLNELVSESAMERTRSWFQRYGLWFVTLSRFSAGIRFFVSIIAGISKMNLLAFSLAFSLGVLIWNTLLLYGGFMLGDNWMQILDILKIYNRIVISLIILALAGFGYWRWRASAKAKHVIDKDESSSV
ncbi:MAG: DedA family protein, partial [Leptospiraceae bacterium]|nr:DedA family protein [Leptospiraceae bacterium]